MILQLMKRDPALRWVLQLTLAFGVFSALWQLFTPVNKSADTSLFSFAFAVILFRADFAVIEQQDDRPFQAFLPVSVRQVFLSRMLSMLVLLWLPVLAGAAAMMLRHDRGVFAFSLELWSVFTFTFLSLQSAVIRGVQISRRWVNAPIFLWLFCSNALPVISVSSATKMLLLAACWLTGIVIVLKTWQAIPKLFQDRPQKESPAPKRIADSKWISAPTSPKALFRMVFQLRGTAIFALFFLMMFFGTASAFWCVMMVFQWLAIRPQIRWLTALPVSPRALLGVAMLPILIALTGGYLVSVHLPWFPAPLTRGVSVRRSQQLFEWHLMSREDSVCTTPNVLPSLDYWIPAKSGRAPVIHSPWGETFRPPAYRESGFVVYNPYAVGCDNSRRFLEWQFNKATVAIFGRPIALDKNVGPYVEQTPVTKGGRQLVDIAAIIGFSMLAMLIAMVFDWRRFRSLPNWLRIGIMSLVGVGAAGLFLLVATFKLDVIQWIAWTLPASAAGTVAVLIVVLALLYVAIERLFREVEFVDKPLRPHV